MSKNTSASVLGGSNSVFDKTLYKIDYFKNFGITGWSLKESGIRQ